MRDNTEIDACTCSPYFGCSEFADDCPRHGVEARRAAYNQRWTRVTPRPSVVCHHDPVCHRRANGWPACSVTPPSQTEIDPPIPPWCFEHQAYNCPHSRGERPRTTPPEVPR